MRALLTLVVLMSLDTLLKTGDCLTGNKTGDTSAHDQVLSITPSTEEQAVILRNIINTTHNETLLLMPASSESIEEGTEVILFVPADSSETIRDLVQRNITHWVVLDNVRELIEMQMKAPTIDGDKDTDSSAFYEAYHPLEEIYEWINQTAQMYPNMVERILIGTSFEKRPLYVLKLSGEKRGDKKALWMDCGIHAREWISPAFCLWFVQHCLTTYEQNQETKRMLDNLDIYVLPVTNPDGYKYTWHPSLFFRKRMWRKNRSPSKDSSCIGVDLNRNFDARWCTEGASHDPCLDTYCGSSPESELETQAVANFFRSHNDSLQIYFAIHSYSQKLLFPYSYTFDKAPNHDELYELVEEVAELIKNYSGNNYTYGAGASTIYLAPGGSDDFAYDQGMKYSFTFELQDLGEYGFFLPKSSISSACHEALIGVKTIALRVIEKTKPDSQQTSKHIIKRPHGQV